MGNDGEPTAQNALQAFCLPISPTPNCRELGGGAVARISHELPHLHRNLMVTSVSLIVNNFVFD